MFGKQKQMGRWIAIAVAMGMLCVSLVSAQKPPKPPDDSGGTIYYHTRTEPWAGYVLNSMKSDGTAKQLLPLNVNGDPSRLLHGGFRWFSQLRFIDRRNARYPDNLPRWDLFAVREDGNEDFTVQLTDDPTLQFLGNINFYGWVRWLPGEWADSGAIAGRAQRWVFDEDQEAWQVDPYSIGLYLATVEFDEDGNVIGLAAPPMLFIALPGGDYDWSPDLLEIVYSTSDRKELHVLDVMTGQSRILATASRNWMSFPAWSPDGKVIAFADLSGEILTIRPDGTGQKTLIKRTPNYGWFWPHWSPTGSHLVCKRDYWSKGNGVFDLFRFTANGGGTTNLTADITDVLNPVAWR